MGKVLNRRKIGSRGRFSLPIEIMRQLDIEEGDYLYIDADDEKIILKKQQNKRAD